MLKPDSAAEIFPAERRRTVRLLIRDLLFFIQKFENSFRGRRGGLEQVCHVGHLGNRLVKGADILDKGLDISDGDASVQRQVSAQNADRHIRQISDEVCQRHHQTRKKLGFPRGFIELFVVLVKHLLRGFLPVKGFDNRMSRIHFFHMTVDFAQILLLSLEVALGLSDNQADNQHGQRQYNQRCDRHQEIDADHHNQNPDDHRDTGDNLGQTLGKGLVDGFNVIYHAALNFTVGLAVKIFQRQPIHFLGHGAAQLIRYFLGNARHNIPLNRGKEKTQSVEDNEQNQDIQKRAEINSRRRHEPFYHFIRGVA